MTMTPADIPRKYKDVSCALPMMPRRRVSVDDHSLGDHRLVSLPNSGSSLRKGKCSLEDVGALVDRIVAVQLNENEEFLHSNGPSGCTTHDDDASVDLGDMIKHPTRGSSFCKQARRASRRSTRMSFGSNSISSLPMLESYCHGSSVGDSLWNSSVDDSMASVDFSEHFDIIQEHEKGELIRNLVRIDTSLLEENELCPVARCATMQQTSARWEHPTRGDSMPSLPGACRGSSSG